MSDKVIGQAPVEVVNTDSPKPAGEVQEASFIDKRRETIESSVMQTAEVTVVAPVQETNPAPDSQPAPAKEEAKKDTAPTDEVPAEIRVKEKIQKRIDKEVAKRKSAEEELAETRAELERLRAAQKPTETKESLEKREPTDAEVRAALIKAKQDGDTEFEVQILEYMAERKAKKERLDAMKDIEEQRSKETSEAQRLQADWQALVKDYLVYDDKGTIDNKHELNLNNQNGLLYKTALALFNDAELRQSHYNDSNKVFAFRRAVGDAYREIHQNDLLKNVRTKDSAPASGEVTPTSKRVITQLAEPGSETSDDVVPTKPLSDTEKVVDEIKNRRKFINERARA